MNWSTLRRLRCISQHLQQPLQHLNAAHYLQTSRVSFAHVAGTEEGVKWLQPAGAGARRMEPAHQKGVLHFPTMATINMAKPLKIEDFEKTLVHMYKKMLPLRTCFRYRDGVLWICEMESMKIDFKEVRSQNTMHELRTLMDCHYNTSAEGPLWRVRLMRDAPDTPCPIPKVKEYLPYQYSIFLSYHHGMTDGNVSLHIAQALFMILKDVITGIPIDDEEQLAVIASDEETLLLKQGIKEHFEKHPEDLKEFANRHLYPTFTPLLYEAFGFPMDPNPTTRYLISSLDTSTFEKLHEKCTEAGVTFNTGFTLAINTALVELVREAGIVRDVYDITSRHAVNLRRYWKSNRFWSFGCHVGRMPQVTKTPFYSKEEFWKCAKVLNTQMKEKLKGRQLLKEEVARELLNMKTPIIEDNVALPLPIDTDYFISNAFLPNSEMVEINKHLQVTNIKSFIDIHFCEYMTFHLVSSVPGCVTYTISYSTWHITDENAKRFLKKVETIVEDLVK